MNRFLKLAFVLGIGGSFVLGATYATQPVKVLREYKGVKLGMKRAEVRSALGNPESSNTTSDDFKLTGEDTMTVHYNNDMVKAIQLAFYEPKNAPAWKDVVGDAQTIELATGAKTARKEMHEEKFWVSIYQNKEGTIVRITISRQ